MTGTFSMMFRIELQKTLGRRFAWIGVAVLVALMSFFYVLFFLFRGNIPASGTRFLYWPDSLIYGLGYASGYASWTSYGTYLLIVLVGVSAAQEYGWRTLQLWLGHGVSRRTVLAAKMLLSVGLAVGVVFLCVLVVAVISAVFSLAVHGGVAFASVNPGQLVAGVARTVFSMLPYAALTFLLAVATRSTLVAIGGAIAFVAVLETALLQILPHLGAQLDRLVQFLPAGLSSALNAPNAAIAGATAVTTLFQPTPPQAAVGIAIYVAVLCGLAFLIFERQDLTQA
jgi:ABC-type transport system involved in multi-copper enzyme maturation permease subunit